MSAISEDQMSKYKIEIEKVKAEWLILRAQNKQKTEHIKNLEEAMDNFKSQIKNIERERMIDREFMDKFEKDLLKQKSASKCNQCSLPLDGKKNTFPQSSSFDNDDHRHHQSSGQRDLP